MVLQCFMHLNLTLTEENPDKLKSDDIDDLIILFKMHTSGIIMITDSDATIIFCNLYNQTIVKRKVRFHFGFH